MGDEGAAAPLLDGKVKREDSGAGKGEDAAAGHRRWWRGDVWDAEEAAGQVAFAAPMVATSMAFYAFPLASVMYAGRIGTRPRITDWIKRVSRDALWPRLWCKGVPHAGCVPPITSAVSSVLVSLLWLYTEQLLIFLHQDPEVSRMAAVFLRYTIPAQFAYGFIQRILRFLQTQSVVMPLVAFSLLPLVFHVRITHASMHYLGLGFAGPAMTTSVSLLLSFVMPQPT
uniref:Uncharacterized protein n=1 Tax=Avena sativa TaxID=4498 RepID=A0ACD5UZA5_AVESA